MKKKKKKTFVKIGNFKIHHWLREIEFTRRHSQHLRDPRYKIDQNQKTSMKRTYREDDGLQKSQKMGNQTLSGHLNNLEEADAKVER